MAGWLHMCVAGGCRQAALLNAASTPGGWCADSGPAAVAAVYRGLDHIRREAEALLVRLEEHYYASAHKGTGEQQQAAPQPDPATATLAELCAQAQALIDGM